MKPARTLVLAAASIALLVATEASAQLGPGGASGGNRATLVPSTTSVWNWSGFNILLPRGAGTRFERATQHQTPTSLGAVVALRERRSSAR